GTDPVAGFAARRLGLDHRFRLVPPPEPRDAIALELALRDVGHVHIEQPFAERLVAMPPQQFDDYGRGGLEVATHLVRERDGERWYAQKIPLGGTRNGTRINRVVAHVRTVIDARDDHLRQVIEQPRDREMDAVGGRAVYEQKAVRSTSHGERPVQRQRVRSAGAVALRRDDGDVGMRSKLSGEAFQTGREVAVVVTEQDAHRHALNGARGSGEATSDRPL